MTALAFLALGAVLVAAVALTVVDLFLKSRYPAR
jgi:hypothetical protein